AASAIDEAIRNNTSVGGRRIALLDNFVWGSPEKPDRLGSLLRACEACYDFAKGFSTPFISGKDSLYNESPLGPVTPTLLITAIGIIPDVRKAVSMDLKEPGNLIYSLGLSYPELGASEYYRLKGFIGGTVPTVRVEQATRTMSSLIRAMDAGYIRACHDLSDGGLAVAAAEMAFSGGYGANIDLAHVPRSKSSWSDHQLLFSESNSRFLVEVPEKHRAAFEGVMKDSALAAIGRVGKDSEFYVHGLKGERVISADLSKLIEAWKATLGM
ncbi:MAG: AIR synthase-related protein, partial [Candidatus Bathyarchaeota archaeon]|nr:AIR synthase-related protein [Candidatus Bathyarchaeota archaeon]